MKLYRTLVQPLFSDDRDLAEYFSRQHITYRLGADRQEELTKFGYNITDGEIMYHLGMHRIVATYVVLLEDSDLSAIMLTVPEIQIIKNRAWYNFINKIRGCFSWCLD